MTGVPPTGSGSRASHEAASASSPKASIPNAKWVREPFRMKVRGERGPEWWTVNGYSNGTFGLDRRRYLDDETCNFAFGYCVTHLPTGYAVRYVRAPLAKAKEFVSALQVADWDFADPEKAKADNSRTRAVRAACELCETSDGMGFDLASAIEAGTAETPESGSVHESAALKGDAHA